MPSKPSCYQTLLMLLALGVGMFQCSAAFAASIASGLEECRKDFLDAPSQYDSARCFFSRSSGHEDAAIALVEGLMRDFPDALYLRIVRAHFMWASDLARAQSIYRQAASEFQRQGDDAGECVARANLAATYSRTRDAQSLKAQVRLLDAIATRSKDLQARALAVVTIAMMQAFQHWSVGEKYQRLAEFSTHEILSLPYSVQRLLLIARGNTAITHLDFPSARADAELLRKRANEEQDFATVAEADYLMVRFWAGQERDQKDLGREKSFEKAMLRALASARLAGREGLEAITLGTFATFLAGQGKRQEEGLRAADKCLSLTEAKDPRNHGFCLVAKSRLLRNADPELAWKLAQDAVRVQDASLVGLSRVVARRNLMQRAWGLLDTQEALRLSNEALDEIESLRLDQRGQVSRRQIFSVWADDYLWLSNRILSERGEDELKRISLAFEIAERAKARTLVDILDEGQGQDERAASARDDGFVTLQDIQGTLSDQEAMLSFQTGPGVSSDGEDYGKTWAIIITRSKVRAVRIPVSRVQFEHYLGSLQGSILWNPVAARSIKARLRAMLIEPVEHELPRDVESLVIIPSGPLAAVPWTSLVPEYQVSTSPSARVWSELYAHPTVAKTAHGIVFFDPKYQISPKAAVDGEMVSRSNRVTSTKSQGLARLHHSRGEAESVAQHLSGDLEFFHREAASASRLMKSWNDEYNFLHLSAHSAKTGELAILLAAEQRTQSVSELRSEQIDRLKIREALVVLAGCGTASGVVVPGEGVLSLARAFQNAGARAVVASLWPVDDRKTARFFSEFYRSLGRGQTVSASLRDAQALLRKAGGSYKDYGGFVVIGDGRFTFLPRKKGSWARSLLWLGLAGMFAIGLIRSRWRL